MSTINTTNRNYVFPLKDEDLESSNNLLKVTVEAIDTDIHNLFTNKADVADSISETLVDTKISTAISDYDTALDIYGTYSGGDVNTDPVIKTKLIIPNVNANPGWTSRVNVNAKGQIIDTAALAKANISDFVEAEYMHLSGTETITGDKTFTGVVNLSGGSTIPAGDIFDDASTTSTSKGWTAFKIFTSLGSYVPLTSYSDATVLSKVQTASGASGAETLATFGITDAYTKTETEALNWAWSDITSGLPTTISGYGITDAYTKTETYTKTEVNALNWAWGDITSGLPTTISGYGITDAYTKTEVDTIVEPDSGITGSRPTTTVVGYFYFDTTLGQPIWWDGAGWVDATGTTA